jgi:hypothetical protein
LRKHEAGNPSGFHNELLDVEIEFFLDEAWFTLTGNVNRHKQILVLENPHTIHDVPPNDCEVGVWCAVNARTVTAPASFEEVIHNSRNVVPPDYQI